MTVRELMSDLSKFDPNMEVFMPGCGSEDGNPMKAGPASLCEIAECPDYGKDRWFLTYVNESDSQERRSRYRNIRHVVHL